MTSLASHVPSVPESGIRRIFELALHVPDVISLAVGEPDVAVAPHILKAGSDAWLADDTNYTPNGGIAPLRQAIVEKLAAENKFEADIEQVWVTNGGTQALHLAMSMLLGAGDEILIPDPGYTTFTMSPRILDAVPVPYSLLPEHGFQPDIEELDRLVTDRTKVIIVNSPSNPLGVVFDRDVLRTLIDFAERHDLWIISDEVYERLTFGQQHVSMASLDPGNRVFSIYSVSKTYALTGARVGYLVTPPAFAVTLRAFQEATIGCINTPAQWAAVAAITGDQTHVETARAHYQANLSAAMQLLDDRGFTYLRPGGAIYLWIDVSHATGGDVAGWAEKFVLEDRVAIAPGSAFGRAGEGWIRICAAASREAIIEGLSRIPVPAPAPAR